MAKVREATIAEEIGELEVKRALFLGSTAGALELVTAHAVVTLFVAVAADALGKRGALRHTCVVDFGAVGEAAHVAADVDPPGSAAGIEHPDRVVGEIDASEVEGGPVIDQRRLDRGRGVGCRDGDLDDGSGGGLSGPRHVQSADLGHDR